MEAIHIWILNEHIWIVMIVHLMARAISDRITTSNKICSLYHIQNIGWPSLAYVNSLQKDRDL